MGNNCAYTTFEATVMAAYNRGVLDKDFLSDIMEIYRDMDIDSGDSEDLISADGLDVEEVCIKVFGLTLPAKPPLVKPGKGVPPAVEEAWEKYWDTKYDLFRSITDQFDWC